MPVYAYRGVAASGRAARGFIDADNARAARAKLRRDIRAVAKGKPISRPEGTPEAPVPTYGGDTVVRVPKRNQDDRRMMAQVQEAVAAIYFSADHLTSEARAEHIRRGVTEKFPS